MLLNLHHTFSATEHFSKWCWSVSYLITVFTVCTMRGFSLLDIEVCEVIPINLAPYSRMNFIAYCRVMDGFPYFSQWSSSSFFTI